MSKTVDKMAWSNQKIIDTLETYHRAIKYQFLLKHINIQITQVILIFQSFWSYKSIRNSQISTDCFVLTNSVFFVLCAYFDGPMVFFDEFLP